MAKLPINNMTYNKSIIRNLNNLYNASRPSSSSPYKYGGKFRQFGTFNKYNDCEYIPSVNVGEEVLGEGGVTKPNDKFIPIKYFTSYFTTTQFYNILDTPSSKLSLISGDIDFYIVNDFTIEEYCNAEQTINSKYVKIYNDDSIDYTWEDNHTSVIVNHNLSGIINYVLRFKNLNRILTTDIILNDNQIKIYLPEQISLAQDEYFELILYRIDTYPFNCKTFLKNEIYVDEQNAHSINSPEYTQIFFDSIIRINSGNRALFNYSLNNDLITYNLPNNELYKNLLNEITLYTNENNMCISITDQDSDNVQWITLENNPAVIITHNLNGYVDVKLKKSNNNDISYIDLMVNYSDYILNENQVLIIFPNTENNITNLDVNIFKIHSIEEEIIINNDDQI